MEVSKVKHVIAPLVYMLFGRAAVAAPAKPSVAAPPVICAWSPSVSAATTTPTEPQCGETGVIFLRENAVPMCEWGGNAHRYQPFVSTPPFTSWTCTGDGPWDGRWNDTCTLDANGRPTNASYYLSVRDRNVYWTGDLSWPDVAFYGSWGMSCERIPSQSTDRVVDHVLDGRVIGGTCAGTNPTSQSLLAQIDGGTVEHVRPALVRGLVTLGGNWWDTQGQVITATLALQVFGDQGWVDYAVSHGNVTTEKHAYEVAAYVAPGTDVRLEVRASTPCHTRDSETFDMTSARLQVETCIPDQSSPGSCL